MERADTKLAQLGTSVREMLAFECAAKKEIRAARAEFLQEIVTRNVCPTRRPRRWRALLLGGGVAVLALALWAWARLPLTFEIGARHQPGRAGDLVRATGDTPLRFSDGSSLALHEGGRLRVLGTNARGARVLVEDGTVEVRVAAAYLGKKKWRFEAGPFSVQVTGTRFHLSYRATDQSLGLATQEGQVVVSGGCLSGATSVRAGARLDLSCLAKPSPAPAAGPPAAEAPPARSEPAPSSSPRPRGSAWRELLAAGRLREGIRAAEQADFDRVCQTATSKELLILADAARLFDRTARALTCLRALRERFASSPEAATAAFTLGRIAFEQRHAYADATRWFATYLREQPSGPLMGDAFGRLMEARLRAGDQAGARSDAEQYLRRFPEGPYAQQARGILSM